LLSGINIFRREIRLIKKAVPVLIVFSLLFSFFFQTAAVSETNAPFSDVPASHWAYEDIHQLRDLNITYGIGNNQFGFGLTISRGEFLTFLVRLMGWEIIKPSKGSFLDNTDPNHNFYGTIETGLINGVIKKDGPYFRTNDAITREEMAIMIVRALGYDTLANQLDFLGAPFADVKRNYGYITIGRDLGIIAGDGINFNPDQNATREQAAAMMMRMYNKLHAPMDELHAFYAINSASQIDKFRHLDSVSFGWARIEYDEASGQVIINTDAQTNEYYIPTGCAEVMDKARKNNLSCQLMFFVKDQDIFDKNTQKTVNLAQYIVSNPEIGEKVINSMAAMVNSINKHGCSLSFDGMVADFEGLRGQEIKQAYNEFLEKLKNELNKTGKKLYVAVHPKRKPGQAYFDGYDYKTIGKIADKVILMAHDYAAVWLTDDEMKNGYTDTPLTPFDEIYYALKSISDPVSGVEDKSKIWLQISMDAVQWKLKDGQVINRIPYHPTYDLLIKRFLTGVSMNYSEFSQNPYAKFYDSFDNTQNIIWYENQKSVAEKIKLAKMFGIKGLSLWRLGTIPEYEDLSQPTLNLNIWQEIIKNY
jgi:spore germination protein YaaH